MLDTMVAGAVVGAVTGAARNVAHEAAAMPLTSEDVSAVPAHEGPETPTTREVLSEMAGGAALGAVVGAAKAVMPTEGALGAVAGAAKAVMAPETEQPKTKKRGKH